MGTGTRTRTCSRQKLPTSSCEVFRDRRAGPGPRRALPGLPRAERCRRKALPESARLGGEGSWMPPGSGSTTMRGVARIFHICASTWPERPECLGRDNRLRGRGSCAASCWVWSPWPLGGLGDRPELGDWAKFVNDACCRRRRCSRDQRSPSRRARPFVRPQPDRLRPVGDRATVPGRRWSDGRTATSRRGTPSRGPAHRNDSGDHRNGQLPSSSNGCVSPTDMQNEFQLNTARTWRESTW